MAFFRHSPEMLAKLHAYPKFTSLDAFLTSAIEGAPEEAEYSHYYFGTSTDFTFLFFEGMIESPATIGIMSVHGAFYMTRTPNEALESPEARKEAVGLIIRTREVDDVATFSKAGVNTAREIHLGGWDGLWFPAKYSTVRDSADTVCFS